MDATNARFSWSSSLRTTSRREAMHVSIAVGMSSWVKLEMSRSRLAAKSLSEVVRPCSAICLRAKTHAMQRSARSEQNSPAKRLSACAASKRISATSSASAAALNIPTSVVTKSSLSTPRNSRAMSGACQNVAKRTFELLALRPRSTSRRAQRSSFNASARSANVSAALLPLSASPESMKVAKAWVNRKISSPPRAVAKRRAAKFINASLAAVSPSTLIKS
mmetsp:Transcript_45764/g.132020  ORF Transcript_45764/g.132020 Transcript_45764/m.132020 type:complete len:221 (-) Transcript_45764:272-934(-)